MQAGVGFFDQAGNACIKFHLRGVYDPDPGQEFTGIIDTGFTGFLQLPLQHAFALGLPLHGTVSVTLADGSTPSALAALTGVEGDNVQRPVSPGVFLAGTGETGRWWVFQPVERYRLTGKAADL